MESTFEAIFERQKKLHEGYIEIEAKSGIGLGIISDDPEKIVYCCNYDIAYNGPRYQAVLKDYCWRIVEELSESIVARRKNSPDDMVEEAIDMFTFIIELLIVAGIEHYELLPLAALSVSFFNRSELDKEPFSVFCAGNRVLSDGDEGVVSTVKACQGVDASDVADCAMALVVALGYAGHMLKNRPWCQTERPVENVEEFRATLVAVLWGWFRYAASCGMTREGIIFAYDEKAKKNEARQQGGY